MIQRICDIEKEQKESITQRQSTSTSSGSCSGEGSADCLVRDYKWYSGYYGGLFFSVKFFVFDGYGFLRRSVCTCPDGQCSKKRTFFHWEICAFKTYYQPDSFAFISLLFKLKNRPGNLPFRRNLYCSLPGLPEVTVHGGFYLQYHSRTAAN